MAHIRNSVTPRITALWARMMDGSVTSADLVGMGWMDSFIVLSDNGYVTVTSTVDAVMDRDFRFTNRRRFTVGGRTFTFLGLIDHLWTDMDHSLMAI